MSWPCTWFDRTDEAIYYLRRYSQSNEEPCPINGLGHNAQVSIGLYPLVTNEEGYIEWLNPEPWRSSQEGEYPWPYGCACGYKFEAVDSWQVRQAQLYKNSVSGERAEKANLPIGAMIDMWWDFRATAGPDGKRLGVVLPPGGSSHLWCVDGPSSSNGGWTRSGEIPNVTASPSILTSRYHGFLQNGVLSDSLADRPDPFGEPVKT